jgi:hypothetical protein
MISKSKKVTAQKLCCSSTRVEIVVARGIGSGSTYAREDMRARALRPEAAPTAHVSRIAAPCALTRRCAAG